MAEKVEELSRDVEAFFKIRLLVGELVETVSVVDVEVAVIGFPLDVEETVDAEIDIVLESEVTDEDDKEEELLEVLVEVETIEDEVEEEEDATVPDEAIVRDAGMPDLKWIYRSPFVES